MHVGKTDKTSDTSTHSYFGQQGWETIAPGLNSIDDATYIRGRILTAFEQAEMTDNDVARGRLLRFVIGGGGPTGVELAGAIIEFPCFMLKGRLAWWIWGISHIYFLVGLLSPLVVSIRWLWEYITYGRGARLITGVEHTD